MKIKKFTAMILAAGYGKRLKPLTNNIPKPLIEIKNISLLKNTIDFLFKVGCYKIVINTHYKHQLISNYINTNYKSSNILITYEHEILNTGGGVKNAIPLLEDNNIMVINSDIFWITENEKDVISFVSNYNLSNKCKLLLVEKEKAHGVDNKIGDFSLKKNIVTRWRNNDKMLYYTGLQMIDLKILDKFNVDKFSFNDVWDIQISNNDLQGELMSSNWFHVGNYKGLQEAIDYNT